MGYMQDVDDISVLTPIGGMTMGDQPLARTLLRFGGLLMDPRTGIASWRGRTLEMSADDRRLLAALMRRGGQIISAERLAASAGTTVEGLERRIEALVMALRLAGVSCLPRRARGLGYVLWRD
jgi:DNA-binding response OmpR family regulator